MSSKKMRILLVDDDKDYYFITKDILSEIKMLKFDFFWEKSYESATRTMKENQFDICLLDYRLGERTGLELLHEVIRDGYKGPIIVMTGQDDMELDNEVMKAGASDYLVKGQISPSLLERSIRHALDRKRSEEALVAAKEYAENLISSSIDMIVAANNDQLITEFNPAAEKVFEYSKHDVLYKPIKILFANYDDWQKIIKKIEQEKIFSGEVTKKKKSGEIFSAYLSASVLKDLTGLEVGIIGISRDISVQKRLEGQLLYNAYHDPLTGLPNRKYFMDHLEKTMDYARKNKDFLFAVLFLDVDRFKVINDSLGHEIGDKLLVTIAEKLKECLRHDDIVARFGGDEFVILLKDIKGNTCVETVADKILGKVREPVHLLGHTVSTGLSIGIVPDSNCYDRPEDILRDADTVMYRAKVNGRSNYAMFDKEMHAHAVKLLQLEIDMQRAVANKEFRMYYQPIVSVNDNIIIGAESLIRWNHPQRGIVLPSEFIPLAEETGIIDTLGRWIIKETLFQNKIWYDAGYSNMYLSINVSPRQFRSHILPAMIQEILKETGLNARNFIIEITEGAVMEDLNRSIKILEELIGLGIKIVLDDFGTGFSAINNLRLLPVSGIKIDLSLTKDVVTSSDAATITSAIINMAHGLKRRVTVIAEGVETEEQLEFFRSNNCDMVQGYLFGKPMPSNDFMKLLKENKKGLLC